jgi:hypothetical protein
MDNRTFHLTWTWLWRLFKLRLMNPRRADRFVLYVVDYGQAEPK